MEELKAFFLSVYDLHLVQERAVMLLLRKYILEIIVFQPNRAILIEFPHNGKSSVMFLSPH